MSIPRSQRLKSRKDIQRLMSEGERLKAYPLRMVFQIDRGEGDPGLRSAVSVPKRLHALAVDRNLLKRRIKEASRDATPDLEAMILESGSTVNVMLIYMSSEKLAMSELQPKIILLFQRLQSRISNLP